MSTTALYFFFFTPTTPTTGPALSVSPTSLLFTTPLGVNPPTQTFTVTNVGTGSMNWSLSVAGAGISAIPVIGTAPSTVTVSISVSGLDPGVYNSSITVTAPGASNSPVTIPVSIVVGAEVPTLAVSPLMLHFTAQQGTNPPPMLVQVANLGPGTLDWLTTVLGPNVTVTPVSGVTPATFQVSVNTSGLGVGVHARQIRVDATVTPGPPGEQALFVGALALSALATGDLTGSPFAAFAATAILRISASTVLDAGPAALASAVMLRITTAASGMASAGNLFIAGSTLRITTAGVLTPGGALFAAVSTVRITTAATTLTVDSEDAFEGFGAATTGGAGHPVVHVTTRADDAVTPPVGSLRWALSAGNRTVVFDVSGEINLPDESIAIESNNITIDGRSSSGGITITGNGISIFDASNIIINDLRFRHPTQERDYVGIVGPGCSNIMVTHCSMIGDPYTVLPLGVELGDGGFDVKSGAHDVTMQWCLLGVGKMSLIGSTSSDPFPDTRRVTIHHCAYVAVIDVEGNFGPVGDGYSDRHPLVRRGGTATEITCDFYENIVAYWWRAQGSKCDIDAWANFRRSAYIPAPAVTIAEREQCVKFEAATNTRCHISGNVELGSPPLGHNINTNGNEASPLSAAPVTSRPLMEVFNKVGPRFPRDAKEQERLDSIASFAPFT